MSPEAHIYESSLGGTLVECQRCGKLNPPYAACNCIPSISITPVKEDTPPPKQVGGSHYEDRKIQPIEFIEANDLSFHEANVVKYVTRYKYKNGLEDLKKAKWYIDRLIELNS